MTDWYGQSVENWLMALAALSGLLVRERTRSWGLGIAFFTVCLGGVLVFASPNPSHPELGQLASLSLDSVSSSALAFFLAFTVPFLAMSRRRADAALQLLCWFGAVDAAWVFINWAFGRSWVAGIGTSGMDVYFVAITLPFFLWKRSWIALAMSLAVIPVWQRTGLALIGLDWVAFYFLTGTTRRKAIAVVIPFAVFGLLLWHHGAHLFRFDDRVKIWEIAWHAEPRLFGYGLGSWSYLGPIIQTRVGVGFVDEFHGRGQYFSWLHNDWLQTWFELGWSGLCCTVYAFLFILRGLWMTGSRSKAVMWTVLGLGALSEMPLRLPLTALAAGLLARVSIGDPGGNSK